MTHSRPGRGTRSPGNPAAKPRPGGGTAARRRRPSPPVAPSPRQPPPPARGGTSHRHARPTSLRSATAYGDAPWAGSGAPPRDQSRPAFFEKGSAHRPMASRRVPRRPGSLTTAARCHGHGDAHTQRGRAAPGSGRRRVPAVGHRDGGREAPLPLPPPPLRACNKSGNSLGGVVFLLLLPTFRNVTKAVKQRRLDLSH